MDIKELEIALESILFASGDPVETERLCQILEQDKSAIEAVAQRLMDYYSFERRGIRMLKLDNSYQLCTAAEYSELVRKALETRKPPRLSGPALEVLAIIAYYQPTTKTYVEQMRGVDSSYTVNLLVERGLVEECGRLEVPGRPMLYKTTKDFLRAFGLAGVSELPDLPERLNEAEGQISIVDTLAGLN